MSRALFVVWALASFEPAKGERRTDLGERPQLVPCLEAKAACWANEPEPGALEQAVAFVDETAKDADVVVAVVVEVPASATIPEARAWVVSSAPLPEGWEVKHSASLSKA